VFYYLTDTKSLERFLVEAVADKNSASFLAVEYLLEKGYPTCMFGPKWGTPMCVCGGRTRRRRSKFIIQWKHNNKST